MMISILTTVKSADLFKLHLSRAPSPCWRTTRTMVRLGTGSTLVSSVKKAVPRKSLCQNPFFSPRIIQQEVFFSIHSLCRYNHRNFCIHMATSHGFDSVAQIMARWLHSHWSYIGVHPYCFRIQRTPSGTLTLA